MPVTIDSPYSNDPLPWWRGNLHTHTTNSDGERDPQAVINAYAQHGYDFLMLSDHDFLTHPEEFDAQGMSLIPGNEVSANGPHIVHVDARHTVPPHEDRQHVIDAIVEEGGLAIVAHPNWEKQFAHCPQHVLEQWRGYTGIEIYNGVIRWLEGSPVATDRWDQLLGQGRRVWGFAHDDSHKPVNDAIAWIMVQSPENRRDLLLAGMQMGSFYASTGVRVDRIMADDGTMVIDTANAERIVAVCDFGRRLASVDDRSLVFTIDSEPDYTYVRFECWGTGEAMAWSQPFFVRQVDGE